MKLFSLIIILFLIISCSIFSFSPIIQVTPTLSPKSDITTQTDLPTFTQVPPSILPTSIPLPLEDAENMILILHESNSTCLLPCWFGLTPGETNKQSAKSLLEKLAVIALRSSINEDVGSAHWRINKNDLLLDTIASFTYDRMLSGELENIRVAVDVKKEIKKGGFEIVWENTINEEFLSAYRLPQILSTYGKPKEVLIFANEGWMYFSLILDYSNKGYAIWYSAPLESSGNKYFGCMSKAFIQLYLWDPEFSYTWAAGIVGTGDIYEIDSLNRDFQPLEKVTSMKYNEFYDTFVNGNNSKCLETEKQLWPGP